MNAAFIALALVALAVIVVRDGGDRAGFEVVRREAPAGVDDLLVHVAGAVVSPGVVRAERGDRVADVIERAGGALPEADLSAVNLALRVRDEDIVRIPFQGDPVTLGLIDLNTATPAELETLPGIGPARARGIVEARPIADVDELVERGLVPASVWEQIRLLVTALPADRPGDDTR